MNTMRVLGCLVLLASFRAVAQQAEKDKAPAAMSVQGNAPAGDTQEQPKKPEEEMGAQPVSGDKVKLKNGKVLAGVQVLRSSPKEYAISLAGGAVIIEIPRSQVESIEWDDIDPGSRPSSSNSPRTSESESVISGQKIAPELEKKLAANLSQAGVNFKQVDLLTLLEDLAKRFDVVITIDPSVQAIDPKTRVWDSEPKKESTLLSFFRDDFPARFPNIEIQYEFDHLQVRVKPATLEAPPTANR